MTTPVVQVNLVADTQPMMEAIAELKALIAQSPPWLQWLAVEAFKSFQHSIDLVAVDREHGPAVNASQLRVVAQPADKMLLLLAALRAGNGQGGGGVDFEIESHGEPVGSEVVENQSSHG